MNSLDTILKRKIDFNQGIIDYSIVVPIYNQEKFIVKNISSYIKHTLGNFEIILILDFCSDNTEKEIHFFFDNYINISKNFIKLRIFENINKPLFETKCDNIGFKNADGKYVLEIQADMEMTDTGYNLHLTKPFNLLENVIAVSGRCAHNLFHYRGVGKYGVGKLGRRIETPIKKLNVDRNTFYTYETCNRGPLLIEKAKLKELNYLDEEHYYLDNSDHDLMLRAYLEKKYICGYVPMDFLAPLQHGTIRSIKNKNEQDAINLNELNRLKQTLSGCPHFYTYKSRWVRLKPKRYKMPYKRNNTSFMKKIFKKGYDIIQ